MDKMTYAQPALFALEYALGVLWRSWGIEPAVVMGHSVGEYAAACLAGVFSLEDGLKLVATRGRLMDSLPQTGEMVAVLADEARVAAAVAPYANQAAIAVVNGPQNLVISGTSEAIQAIVEQLTAEQLKTRRLAIAQAAHSPLLDPILDEFERIAAEVRYSPPRLGLISCTTGKLVATNEVTNAAYWRRHLRQPVQFAKSMETLHQQGYRLFVEWGGSGCRLCARAGLIGSRCWRAWLRCMSMGLTSIGPALTGFIRAADCPCRFIPGRANVTGWRLPPRNYRLAFPLLLPPGKRWSQPGSGRLNKRRWIWPYPPILPSGNLSKV
jgi:hypothetical protein